MHKTNNKHTFFTNYKYCGNVFDMLLLKQIKLHIFPKPGALHISSQTFVINKSADVEYRFVTGKVKICEQVLA